MSGLIGPHGKLLRVIYNLENTRLVVETRPHEDAPWSEDVRFSEYEDMAYAKCRQYVTHWLKERAL